MIPLSYKSGSSRIKLNDLAYADEAGSAADGFFRGERIGRKKVLPVRHLSSCGGTYPTNLRSNVQVWVLDAGPRYFRAVLVTVAAYLPLVLEISPPMNE